MAKYEVTITATYLVEIENLERDRELISLGYENPVLPDIIPEDAIEYLEGAITYTPQEG